MQVKNLSTETSEDISSAANRPGAPGVVYVTDASGRRFGLKKLKPSARYTLDDAVDAKTQSSAMQAIVAATVFSIDEEAFTPIRNKDELLRRLDEIDDEGLAAITGPVIELYGLDKKDIAVAKNS